jgi:hypothetical protein
MTAFDRFMAKVKKQPTGCWEWQSNKDADGYGRFWYNNKTSGAHRWIYQHHKGLLHPRLFVCHRCDNPSCVNPDHLFQGTHLDNIKDMLSKNRSLKGIKNGSSKLTDSQVKDIKYSSEPKKFLMKKYNISRSMIYWIQSGVKWKHI